MFTLDLDEIIPQQYLYDNNNDEMLTYEYNEEIVSDKDDYELTSEEKNKLYFINPPQPKILNKEKNDSNLIEKKNESPLIKLNFPNITKTKTTNDNTFIHPKPVRSKEKIFEIKKLKKLGRNKKNKISKNERNHNKNKRDNIATKVKRNVNKNEYKHINLKLSKSQNPKLNKIQLVKIDTSIITVSKKEDNLELLNKKMKDILSNKISSKYLYLEEDYNKKQIEFILKQNDEDINYELNLTYREILDVYSNNKKDNPIFKDFKTLDDDLEELRIVNDQKYLQLYEYTAKNLESIINAIFPRRRRS